MDFGLWIVILSVLATVFAVALYFMFQYGVHKDRTVIVLPFAILFISEILALGLIVLFALKLCGAFS